MTFLQTSIGAVALFTVFRFEGWELQLPNPAKTSESRPQGLKVNSRYLDLTCWSIPGTGIEVCSPVHHSYQPPFWSFIYSLWLPVLISSFLLLTYCYIFIPTPLSILTWSEGRGCARRDESLLAKSYFTTNFILIGL